MLLTGIVLSWFLITLNIRGHAKSYEKETKAKTYKDTYMWDYQPLQVKHKRCCHLHGPSYTEEHICYFVPTPVPEALLQMWHPLSLCAPFVPSPCVVYQLCSSSLRRVLVGWGGCRLPRFGEALMGIGFRVGVLLGGGDRPVA